MYGKLVFVLLVGATLVQSRTLLFQDDPVYRIVKSKTVDVDQAESAERNIPHSLSDSDDLQKYDGDNSYVLSGEKKEEPKNYDKFYKVPPWINNIDDGQDSSESEDDAFVGGNFGYEAKLSDTEENETVNGRGSNAIDNDFFKNEDDKKASDEEDISDESMFANYDSNEPAVHEEQPQAQEDSPEESSEEDNDGMRHGLFGWRSLPCPRGYKKTASGECRLVWDMGW